MSVDHAVRELTIARPKLRSDLRFVFQDHRGRPCYVLEDLTHRRYFQIGLAEYQFLQALNGRQTARDVLSQNARKFGEKALSEQDATVLLRWLLDQQLLETDSADQSGRHYQHTSKAEDKKPKQALQKLFFIRIPMGSPDAFLGKLLPFLGWTASLPFFLVWLVVVGYAGFKLSENWTGFVRASTQVIVPGYNWLLLGVMFIFLKLVHEIWHGVWTKKFGGVVPEWGIQLLIFITPLTYVDASASWRFVSRWQRIYVAAAGMFVELFFAAIAVIVWVNSDPGLVKTLAHNTVFAASTITLLFNANPLMRFDGYYILSDLIRIPNLGSKGQQFTQWLFRKFFFAVKDLPLPSTFHEHPWAIGIYGILSFMWRWVIWIGIMVMASLLFKGAGIVLVAVSLVGMVFGGLYKALKFLFAGESGRRPHLFPALVRITMIIATVVACGYFIHINPAPKAAAVIEFPEKGILRAELAGFVREIHVANGDLVEEGQLLAKLVNPDREAELKQISLDIRYSELRARRYFEDDRGSAHQAELENLKSLQERFATTKELLDSLTVISPVAGRVHADKLESFKDRYVRPGDTIMTIVPEVAPRVLIAVKQEHRKALEVLKGDDEMPITLRLRGYPGSIAATIVESGEQATTAVPHPALASTSGGPLLVRQRSRMTDRDVNRGLAFQRNGIEDSHFSGLGEDENAMITANQELTRARFAAYAVLDLPEIAGSLREGQWGFVKLANVKEERLGVWLFEKVALYIRRKWEQANSI